MISNHSNLTHFALRKLPALFLVVVTLLSANTASAQRPRFEDPFQINTLGLNARPGFQQPSIQPPAVFQPQAQPPGLFQQPVIQGPTIITAPPPGAQIFGAAPIIGQPPTTFQVPNIDRSFTPVNPNGFQLPRNQGAPLPRVNVAPLIQVRPPAAQQAPVLPQQFPQSNLPRIGVPQFNQPTAPQFNPQLNLPGTGNLQLRNQWPYQTPGTNWWPSLEWPSQVWARLRTNVLPRVLERPRFRHTWIQGNNGNELDINDVEIATTATIPNWLNSGQPIRLSPNFIFHFLNGPETAPTGFDLPSAVHSAFLSADFISDPRRRSGIETNLAIGVYTDFRNVASESLRITGTALGWRRVNSYTTAKFGVEYLNRVRVKLLPAFGFFLAPNQDLKIDLYFPRPKIAHRLPGYQGFDVWGYVGAEYGGGSWTIERIGGIDDQVDYNDVRAFFGVEWLGPRRVTGFLEAGYVFERELLYRSDPLTNLDLQDSFMIRSGLAF